MTLTVIFQDYNGTTVPQNVEGVDYPDFFNALPSEGGNFTPSMDATEKVSGDRSVKLTIDSGQGTVGLYADWKPYDGAARHFSREEGYCTEFALWAFNTLTRFEFWFYNATNGHAEQATGNSGQQNFYVGTYVKRVTNPDTSSDETGGDHYYHNFDARRGVWTKCYMDWHPSHRRGAAGSFDPGVLQYPTTGDPASTYNYWDALTRFYISHAQAVELVSNNQPVFRVDRMRFVEDNNVSGLPYAFLPCISYKPSDNSFYMSFNRAKADDTTLFDIKYAFSDIHALGWGNATFAPGGQNFANLGDTDFNCLLYQTTSIDVSGQNTIYFGIKRQDQGDTVFTQVSMPLSLPISEGGGGGVIGQKGGIRPMRGFGLLR